MRVFVKICGITSQEDALGAIAMGADAVGFVFAPSVRQVDRITTGDIVRSLPVDILTVGVFQDHSKENVVRIANKIGLKGVQLHGRETASETKWIKDRVPYVIKSFGSSSPQLPDARKWGADVVLIDAPVPGGGQVFDWEQADNAPAGLRILLAGGLRPENVEAAIGRVKPWGVDVSTGVELSARKKDMSAIRDFVNAVRRAEKRNSGVKNSEPADHTSNTDRTDDDSNMHNTDVAPGIDKDIGKDIDDKDIDKTPNKEKPFNWEADGDPLL